MKKACEKKGGKVIEDYTLFLICLFFVGFFLFLHFPLFLFSNCLLLYLCCIWAHSAVGILAFSECVDEPVAYPVYVRTMILNFLFCKAKSPEWDRRVEEDPGKNNLGNRTGVAEVYSAKVRLELMHWRLSHGGV